MSTLNIFLQFSQKIPGRSFSVPIEPDELSHIGVTFLTPQDEQLVEAFEV
jgi:hypothetical protein